MKVFDFKKVLVELQTEMYCIIKHKSFDEYKVGDDCDIFCLNYSQVIKKILSICNDMVFNNDFELLLTEKVLGKHAHIDLVKDDKIIFRFDIYADMPSYKSIIIKDSYFSTVIENSIEVFDDCDGVPFKYFVPDLEDELILRYIEFKEYYDLRPDKIKHLDYIIDVLESDIEKKRFINKLHYYTKLPDIDDKEKVNRNAIKEYYYKIRETPMKDFPSILKRKLRRIFNADN